MEHKVLKKQTVSQMCFVCGIQNESSLHMNFYEMDDGKVVGTLNGKDIHQSYPDRMHGGNICAALDETIGRVIWTIEDIYAVTMELKIKYRKPVPLNQNLIIVAELIKNTPRMFEAKGSVIDENGTVLATGEGTYFKLKNVDKKEMYANGIEVSVPDDIKSFNY